MRIQGLACFLRKISRKTPIATKRKTFRTRFKGKHNGSFMGEEESLKSDEDPSWATRKLEGRRGKVKFFERRRGSLEGRRGSFSGDEEAWRATRESEEAWGRQGCLEGRWGSLMGDEEEKMSSKHHNQFQSWKNFAYAHLIGYLKERRFIFL